MPSRSRSRYDDDRVYRRSDESERGNGGRGHGGWSGDPEAIWKPGAARLGKQALTKPSWRISPGTAKAKLGRSTSWRLWRIIMTEDLASIRLRT
jgi:hypothetical protein